MLRILTLAVAIVATAPSFAAEIKNGDGQEYPSEKLAETILCHVFDKKTGWCYAKVQTPEGTLVGISIRVKDDKLKQGYRLIRKGGEFSAQQVSAQ